MDAISHPFRFVAGRVARVPRESDEFAAQRIAAAIQTRPLELPINPTFGSIDPEFSTFDTAGLMLTASNFLADVQIDDIVQEYDDDGRVKVTVQFTRG